MDVCGVVLRPKYIFNEEMNVMSDKVLMSPESELPNLKEGRRGRPRADAVTTMMKEGSSSPSAIKCRFCMRVFPREKSLQTHVRTHTGRIICGFKNSIPSIASLLNLKNHKYNHM